MKVSRPVAFGMGAVTALVLGSGTAYAATGGKFILGKSNSATTTTVLTNSRGTALTLNSKAGTPSLRVNRTTKVPYLNSDLLDGYDSTKFALAAGAVAPRYNTGTPTDLSDPADGVSDAIVATVGCPYGTRLTGGGGADFTPDGATFYSGPNGTNPNAWTYVVATTDTDGTDVEVYAECYNPRGAVASNFREAPVPTSKDLLAKLAKRFN